MEPKQPHEAMFLVLTYLNLFELLKMKQVCRSLREAIENDLLLWLNIVVEPPLNLRINDDILLNFASKSFGRLITLALWNCIQITDDGLLKVTDNNPHITKLYVPSCTQLTPDGIVRVVKRLTEQPNHKLKSLMLHNIPNMTKEHLQVLNSCLKVHPTEERLQEAHMFFYHGSPSSMKMNTHPIDIQVCPKCDALSLVFDCPREACRLQNATMSSACRGCLVCVPRCEGCGGCVDLDETGETICLDLLCLNCWLKAPKCDYCNKPYCHRCEQLGIEGISQYRFVCEVCTSEVTMHDGIYETGRTNNNDCYTGLNKENKSYNCSLQEIWH